MAEEWIVEYDGEIFNHSYLEAAARHFHGEVQRRAESDFQSGLSLYSMAALIFFAFEFEAKLNFLSERLFDGDWNERARWRDKAKNLNRKLNLQLDWNKRPWSTIEVVFNTRDQLAHGKIERIERTERCEEVPDVWDALRANWKQQLTPSFLDLCSNDLQQVVESWRQASGLNEINLRGHMGQTVRRPRS